LTLIVLFFTSFSFAQTELFNRLNKANTHDRQKVDLLRVSHENQTSKVLVSKHGHLLENPLHKASSTAGMQKLDSLIGKDPDTDDLVDRSMFLYDDDGNNTLWRMSMWLMGWEDIVEEHYTYDNNGNMTSHWIQFNDGNGWIKEQKFTYSYDGANRLIQHMLYYWSYESSDWEVAEKTDYTYDEEGVLQETLMYILEEGEWVLLLKTEYTYDDDGNMTKMLVSAWYFNQWFEYQRTEYTYENGNLTEEIMHEMDLEELMMLPLYKDSHTYDQNGNRTQTISQEWLDAWVNDYKENYTFDSNDNLLERIYSEWTGDAWQNSDKSDFTYNNDYGFDDLILPYFYATMFPELFNHLNHGGNSYLWNDGAGDWTLYDITTLHYSELGTTSIKENSSADVTVYPNPAQDFINIEFDNQDPDSQLELFDITGRKVLTTNLKGNQKVDISLLENGLYIYRVNQDGMVKSGKILVE
jgi:hypothetical protein